ncbi:ricin-type beta-trefoil lectin domain protein [Streptomyces sp. NPDC101110]|uniref:ricin-type beta-trefoil lectin domain protein n=1 Tax=unclassified Streptomyces TaxID=2593676 RepID=UPI0038305298
MDRTTAIVILILVSLLILGAVYLLLRARHAGLSTQFGVLGLAATILGLLATYSTAILEGPSTAGASPAEVDAAPSSPAPQKTVLSPSPAAEDGTSSADSPQPRKKSATWQHIRAMNSPYKGLCMAAEGDAVVTAPCLDSKAQLWKTTDRGEIITRDGRCLSPEGLGGGQTMLTQACTGSAAQKWKWRDGRMWSDALCLTIRGPYATPGATIQTWNTEQDPKPADEMFWGLSA